MKISNRYRLDKQLQIIGLFIAYSFSVSFLHPVKTALGVETPDVALSKNFNKIISHLNPLYSRWSFMLNPSINDNIKSEGELLFHISRTTNPHDIYYDVNLNETGKLDVLNPMDIYWIKKENGENRIPISWVERTFGYGIKTISISEEQLIFQFVAYDKRNFHLKMDKLKKFRVYTSSQGIQIELSKLHIYVSGGTILVPKISRIEVHGKDIHTGMKTLEIVNM